MAFRIPLYSSSLLLALLVMPAFSDDSLLTVAEKSEFQATSKHAEVVELCQRLAKASPRVKYSEFGTTSEGRKLPLLVIADPPIGTPAEAAKSGKAVVLVFANIHAGEVDGKEGVLMLARELAEAKDSPILKNVVTLIVPDLNADGNDKFGVQKRNSQEGPAQGMGIRENSVGLDLNRDFIKLESPEDTALVQLINQWDPAIIVVCHTTNGSLHRHLI